ncbi:MAG: response regulator [Chitinophagales bacterium]|jgi:class 3 adenylate cyclase|nr:response regulator [Chitinophagales bacterium]
MKATILIVDDESDNIDIIADYLEQENPDYQLLQAANGQLALKIIEKNLPDLILTDWNMPVMDGLELVQALKNQELTRDIPVIMQTAETEDTQLKKAFEAGVMDYIKKPVSRLELIARVKSALALRQAQKRTEELLLNILPKEVAEELKEKGKVKPKPFEQATILFTDFKGFSSITQGMEAEAIVEELDKVFMAMDRIIARYNLEKIKTIGDAYMCAGGIPIINQTHALDAINAAFAIQTWMAEYKQTQIANNQPYFECRLGIHTGKVVAGVVGESKFAYDIWGSAVNVASRMESSGEAGMVNISGTTYELIKDQFQCTYRGKIPIKNMGEVDMYFVEKMF